MEQKNAQTEPVLSFGRFHESGGFPKGWPFGRARRRETPQQPDLMYKDWTKTTNQRQPSGILNEKALRIVYWGLVHCGIDALLG